MECFPSGLEVKGRSQLPSSLFLRLETAGVQLSWGCDLRVYSLGIRVQAGTSVAHLSVERNVKDMGCWEGWV